MAVRCETLLRYMLGTFYDINTDVLSREIGPFDHPLKLPCLDG
jgi:hypothetical protein